MRYVILGTAGHIDHGKSSLVKAMTGVDPDRLKEEKERGITIDIGFAELAFPDDKLSVGIVDVPGHERLIRNMLAGAGGIDLVLLVIAADEGVMPQSREHLHICDLLRIKSGIVVVTKTDLVEPEWVDLVADEVRGFVRGSFLEGADIVPVSSKTGAGLDVLRERIREIALTTEPKPARGLLRIPIDRVFTLKGFGTVVTGTAVSGAISVGEAVEILPRGIETKVRGLHSHGRPVQKAFAGQRVAVNLQGVETDDLVRGDTLVASGRFRAVTALDARVELLADSPPLKNRSQVHFHLSTSETLARVILYGGEELAPGGTGYCQLRLQHPVVAQLGDRFVVRRLSPLQTMGGGKVLDPSPARRRRKDGVEDLEVYDADDLRLSIARKARAALLAGMTQAEIEGWVRAEVPEIAGALAALVKEKELVAHESTYLHREAIEVFRASLTGLLAAFHKENPLKPGVPKEELRARLRVPQRVFGGLLAGIPEVVVERDLVRLKRFTASLSEEDTARVALALDARGFQPPSVTELARELGKDEGKVGDILKLMAQDGRVVRVNDAMYIARGAYEAMLGLLRGHFSKSPEMTVADFRDLLGTTRKYALPFLEYLDTNRVTLRVGEVRKLLLK